MICDLAEYYHILNYQELSPYLVATLVLGLRDDSRVKKIFSKTKVTFEQLLLTSIFDSLQFLCWTKTKDAQHGRNKPKSLMEKILGFEKENDLIAFSTPEEYEAYMAKIK